MSRVLSRHHHDLWNQPWVILVLALLGGVALARGFGRPGGRALVVYAGFALGMWLVEGFLAHHDPNHNLYWVWLLPAIPFLAVLGAGGWFAVDRRLAATPRALRVLVFAVLLNITPDHLDRYDGDFDAYAASKSRLFAMQTRGHNSIARFTDARSLGQFAEGSIASILEDVLANRGIAPAEQADWPSLQGPHNLENAAAAIEACDILGLSVEQIRAGLRSFPGLPHRMERVGERGGVLYVNDSKATNTAAAAPALAAFDKIHWIVGGQAKEPGLGECEQHLGHVTAAYTIGEAGEDFAEALTPHCAVSRCGTLDKAVELASQVARAGETVLLSPACASFDQFRDFEDRGDQFRQLVRQLADSEASL